MGKRLKEKPTHLWMSPATIETVAKQVYGESWRQAICADFDISYSQLHRYMTLYKNQGVPKTFALSLLMRRDMDTLNMPRTQPDAFKVAIGEAKPVRFSGRSDQTPSAGLDFGSWHEPIAPATVEVIEEAKQTMAKAEKAARTPRKAAAKPVAKVTAPAKAKARAKAPVAKVKTPAKAKPQARAKATA